MRTPMTAPLPRIFELPALPPVLPAFVRAALSASRRPVGPVVIPDWSARVPALKVDARQLADYRTLCGFQSSHAVPITYPQVLATPLYLYLMTQPGFPLPLMGLVHVRNAIEQRRALTPDETLDLRLRFAGSREVRTGLELDLVTEFLDPAGELLWRATMTVLRMKPRRDDAAKPAPAAPVPQLAHYRSLTAPADTGRAYARVSKDYNPIHLSALTAKPFGFPRAIAHGMWSAARALALLEEHLGATPQRFDVQFKRPLLLPGHAALRYAQERQQIDFSLLDAAGGRVHLAGTLR